MLARRDQRSSTEDTLNEPLQFTYVAVLFTLDLHQQFTVGSLAEQTCTAPILLHQYYYTNTSTALLRPSLLTIIMSSERPSETNLIPQATGSFKGKLSSLLHLSRAPTGTLSSIEMDSSSDKPASAR